MSVGIGSGVAVGEGVGDGVAVGEAVAGGGMLEGMGMRVALGMEIDRVGEGTVAGWHALNNKNTSNHRFPRFLDCIDDLQEPSLLS